MSRPKALLTFIAGLGVGIAMMLAVAFRAMSGYLHDYHAFQQREIGRAASAAHCTKDYFAEVTYRQLEADLRTPDSLRRYEQSRAHSLLAPFAFATLEPLGRQQESDRGARVAEGVSRMKLALALEAVGQSERAKAAAARASAGTGLSKRDLEGIANAQSSTDCK